MGLMNASLHIGRTALLSYQSALQTVGSNISSAASPDYTRLTPQLVPLQGPLITGNLQPGAGVALTGIQRNIDEALESRIRDAIGAQESGATQRTSLSQVEAFLDDVDGTGVNSRLRDLFSSFDNLQNTPEDGATRDLVLSAGAQLAESLKALRANFAALGEDLDGQIAGIVGSADELARRIGDLNEEITTAEAGRNGQATGLRDQRDALLRDLSELFDVTVRRQPDGVINVYIGSEALIQGNFVRQLVAVQEFDGEFARTSVRFADTNGEVDVRGGRLQGLITSRDEHGYGQVELADKLAHALIAQLNQVHADGQGLVGFESVTGSYSLLATDVALNATEAGLAFTPRNGSFFITVADNATGTPIAYRVDVAFNELGQETTLESLVADINAQVQDVTATITAGNRLTLTAAEGFTFTLGHDGQTAREDTSNVLASLGINTFFTGTDARNIAVSDVLTQRPMLVAAASAFHAGDGGNAGLLATLETSASTELDGATIRGFYNSILSASAVASAAARDDLEASSSILSSLSAQKESISGVNLDEEAISLLKFERAFQGVSRFVSVVDGLI
ncbi:MAG: flagellar hook-associated protein FlgK, partial [Planctomycetes bacterium]|nr:flagellar hook-associated protein FlgK [Planctomycetota bacterium]